MRLTATVEEEATQRDKVLQNSFPATTRRKKRRTNYSVSKAETVSLAVTKDGTDTGTLVQGCTSSVVS